MTVSTGEPTAVRTIADLITSDLHVSADEPIEKVLKLWESHPAEDGMAVVGEPRVKFLSRARFFLQLGRRFGYSLFEKRPASLLAEEGSTVEADMDPVEVISVATQREPQRVYDDILVVEGGSFRGLVSMRSLIIHHKGLLVSGIAERALLEERNRQIRDLSRAQGTFMAGLTEELRRPANTLLGLAQALAVDTDPTLRLRHLDSVRAHAQEVVGILSELQDVAGLARGDLEPMSEDCEVGAVLNDVLVAFRASSQGMSTDLRVQITKLPSSLFTDPLFLRRILLNVLAAAIRLNPSGVVTLDLFGDETGLRLTVAHQGPATTEGGFKGLLDDLEEGEAAAAKQISGTGLRLATVKGLVRLLGGNLSAQGTTTDSSLAVFIPPGVSAL